MFPSSLLLLPTDMTYILYIDTSGNFSRIMLFDREKIRATRITTEANQHAQSINTHIEQVMHEAGIKWDQLSAVAVLNGPGSYTGLRIGLATAKGFCYAMDIPLILLNHLDLMLFCSDEKKPAPIYFLKARENEYFVKRAQNDAELNETVLMTKEDLIQASAEGTLYTTAEDIIQDFDRVSLIRLETVLICKYVFMLYDGSIFADLMHCEPFYLKNVFINKINKL